MTFSAHERYLYLSLTQFKLTFISGSLKSEVYILQHSTAPKGKMDRVSPEYEFGGNYFWHDPTRHGIEVILFSGWPTTTNLFILVSITGGRGSFQILSGKTDVTTSQNVISSESPWSCRRHQLHFLPQRYLLRRPQRTYAPFGESLSKSRLASSSFLMPSAWCRLPLNRTDLIEVQAPVDRIQ